MKIKSEIVFRSSNFLIKLTILVSVLLLLQGHNKPGGGFIGGLTFICAYILMKINIHERYLIESIGVRKWLLVVGLLLITISVLYPVWMQNLPMTGVWHSFCMNDDCLKIGTPLIFDIGVYMVVAMSISFIVDALEKSWF